MGLMKKKKMKLGTKIAIGVGVGLTALLGYLASRVKAEETPETEDGGGFWYDIVIDPETNTKIPIYWTSETGKPNVSFEYRDSISKEVSGTPFLTETQRCYPNGGPGTYPIVSKFNIADGAGVYIICDYPDGTEIILTPSGYVFVNNKIESNLSECIPQTAPVDYTSTDACTKIYNLNIAFGSMSQSYSTCAFGGGLYSFPDVFWFTPVFVEYNNMNAENFTGYTLTKIGSSNLGYNCRSVFCYITAKKGSPEHVLNFLKKKYNMEYYLNLPAEAEVVGHLKNLFEKETENISVSLKSWYYTYSFLCYLYAGYVLTEEGI